MSHFPVLVIGDNIDAQLAAYDETIEVPPYPQPCWCKGSNATCDECHGTGTYMSTYNPKSKWDWYEVGGRWSGWLVNRSGAQLNSLQMQEWDQERAMAAAKSAAEASWATAEATQANPTSRYFRFGIQNDEDRESYVMRRAARAVVPHAVVVNGEWHEAGEMGWFGIGSDDKDESDWRQRFAALLQDVSPGTTITIVDCHI